jgi:hypothetical protein
MQYTYLYLLQRLGLAIKPQLYSALREEEANLPN